MSTASSNMIINVKGAFHDHKQSQTHVVAVGVFLMILCGASIAAAVGLLAWSLNKMNKADFPQASEHLTTIGVFCIVLAVVSAGIAMLLWFKAAHNVLKRTKEMNISATPMLTPTNTV